MLNYMASFSQLFC